MPTAQSFACGLVLLAFAISACGDESASDPGPAKRSVEAERVATATEAVKRTGKPIPGEEVGCTVLTADEFDCVVTVDTADDTGDVALETFYFVLFEKGTLRIGFTGGNVLGPEPQAGAYDCEGSDRGKCITIARKSSGFRLVGANGPLGARIAGDPDLYSSVPGA